MQKPLSSLKPESKASQKWQESQNYAKNPIWNVMLQLRGVGKVVVKILLIQFHLFNTDPVKPDIG